MSQQKMTKMFQRKKSQFQSTLVRSGILEDTAISVLSPTAAYLQNHAFLIYFVKKYIMKNLCTRLPRMYRMVIALRICESIFSNL